MSWSIDTAFVNNYRNMLDVAFQQNGSRLRSTVSVVPQKSEFDYFERIGALANTSAHAMTVRHGDTPLDDIDHTRRRNQMVGYNHALLIDNQDKLRTIIDPQSEYASAQAKMLGRKLDLAIIAAANGTAYSGKAGATTVSFPSSQQVAVDYVESGGVVNSNLTVAKLRQAAYLFDSNEATDETRYIIVTAKQIQGLLRSAEVTSSDYNTVKALVNGQVNQFMGFTFIRTELLTKSSNTRTCFAWVPSAIKVGMGQELKTEITPRADKNYSTQVYAEATFGATRIWEERIVEIKCDESV